MLKCYTISTLKALREIPNLDVCQFTLNARMFPGKRKTVELLKSLSKTCSTKVIVHYDFIYIASRFSLFAPHVRKAIIDEICSILHYASYDNRIIGIVMHTDFPLKKEVLQKPTVETLQEEYKSSLFSIENPEFVINNIDNIVYYNLRDFFETLEQAIQSKGIKTNKRVYLENTTKVGPKNQGNLYQLIDFCTKSKFPHIGICIDSEHCFAVDGIFPFDITGIDVPIIYHLNTIPSEVEPRSKKDRQSFTTLTECSKLSLQQYINFIDYLEGLNIPYVREVKEETMFREMKQLEELGLYGS